MLLKSDEELKGPPSWRPLNLGATNFI